MGVELMRRPECVEDPQTKQWHWSYTVTVKEAHEGIPPVFHKAGIAVNSGVAYIALRSAAETFERNEKQIVREFFNRLRPEE